MKSDKIIPRKKWKSKNYRPINMLRPIKVSIKQKQVVFIIEEKIKITIFIYCLML